jgi:hypothetical protein
MYKIAFITEAGFTGKIQRDNPNMKLDLAWQCILQSDHYPFQYYNQVEGYDFVFIIWPKADVYLNSEGIKISSISKKGNTKVFELGETIIKELKSKNKKVGFIQEGPVWFSNDYDLALQIHHYNIIQDSDFIFCHNHKDANYYRGITDKPVRPFNSIMVKELIQNINNPKEDKTIVGGNFSNWYGGFNSFLVAKNYDNPIWCPSMHNKQPGEEQLINHFPYMSWIDWMKELSKFKYGIHLMPTAAAGTFSLNCAYFGIPCIGNKNLDTQMNCFPNLSIDVNDIEKANKLSKKLKNDQGFYNECSEFAKKNVESYYDENKWLDTINRTLNEIQ